MYTRVMQESVPTPIEQGMPIAGTWKHSFEYVNLLDISRPFAKPLPKAVRDSRIKEWQNFLVQDERFLLEATLSNVKFYRWAQVFLYDKESGQKLWFRKILPFSGWRMPLTLSNASVDSRSYGIFFRIHNWLDANIVKVDLDIEPTSSRPSFTAHLEFEIDETKLEPMAVSLLFSEERSMYSYKVLSPVRGDMVFGGQHLSLGGAKTAGLFCDYKGYYPYRMNSTWCNAFGFVAAKGQNDQKKNRRYGFSIAENQARETFKNNENALWIEGKLTPLPPVRITQPNGIQSDWIIQDMEGMIDLVFTPKESVCNEMNLFITNVEYNIPLGYYNGMMVTSEEERIHVHNLCGLGQKLYMRV
ncbi:MAG: DUF2804 domain-containing protein [Treponema sp.]|nr:DUF2804 domain-containing protein [Treponema sp.]